MAHSCYHNILSFWHPVQGNDWDGKNQSEDTFMLNREWTCGHFHKFSGSTISGVSLVNGRDVLENGQAPVPLQERFLCLPDDNSSAHVPCTGEWPLTCTWKHIVLGRRPDVFLESTTCHILTFQSSHPPPPPTSSGKKKRLNSLVLKADGVCSGG